MTGAGVSREDDSRRVSEITNNQPSLDANFGSRS